MVGGGKMRCSTQHLLVIGAVVVVFGLAIVVREEAFVEKTPDIKAEQHAEFEATAQQKEQIQHAAEGAHMQAGPRLHPASSTVSLMAIRIDGYAIMLNFHSRSGFATTAHHTYRLTFCVER